MAAGTIPPIGLQSKSTDFRAMNSPPIDHAISERPDTATPEIAPVTPTPWTTRLRRHLSLAFVAKLILLVLLYILFFSPSQRPHIDAGRVADHLLSPG